MEPQCKLRLIDAEKSNWTGALLFFSSFIGWMSLMLFVANHLPLPFWSVVLLFFAGCFGIAMLLSRLGEHRVLATVRADALLLVFSKTGEQREIEFSSIVSHVFKGEWVSHPKGGSSYNEFLRIELENETLLLAPVSTPDISFREMAQDLADARYVFAQAGTRPRAHPPRLVFFNPPSFADRSATFILVVLAFFYVLILIAADGYPPKVDGYLLVFATAGMAGYTWWWHKRRSRRPPDPAPRRFLEDQSGRVGE